MARWQDLREHIFANYKVSEDNGDGLMMLFSLPAGRSQMVFVSHDMLVGGTEDWVIIESPIAKYGEVDMARALSLVGGMVCGGLGMTGEFITLRDSLPLGNLDINEFERPLQLITSSADDLEGRLLGRDTF